MALFDQTIQISVEDVSSIALAHWDAKLGAIIKASQNHTFEATIGSTTKVVLRVTPDPQGKHQDRVAREVMFVNYIAKTGELEYICAPIRSKGGDLFISEKGLILVLSEWAPGSPLDFMSYRWMTDENVVYAWGKWLANFHTLSRKFSAEHPSVASQIQRWDEMHNAILMGSEIHPDDQAVVHDSEHYGVLHGDLNVSNFFYSEGRADSSDGAGTPLEPMLAVFDWDQTQQGWFLWDVAQCLLTVYMLHEGGSVVDGSPVPAANPARFESWLVAGYESVAGEDTVDRARLARMVSLRKHFYERFCRKAKEQGDIPKDMEHFIHYIVAWFDKLNAHTA